jgi:microcystin-dependent protein
MGQPFVGEIRMVGFNFAPAGWAFCNGALIPISENDTLFNLIGTTYGGDGQNTFALPNLQSRIPVHAGQSPGTSNRVLGEMAGTETVTLATNQIPAHNHPAQATTGSGNQATPQNGIWAASAQGAYSTSAPSLAMKANLMSSSGGSQPHDNMMPFLTINFIISLYGIYPSQV